jgi:hypothetical protein
MANCKAFMGRDINPIKFILLVLVLNHLFKYFRPRVLVVLKNFFYILEINE